MRTPRSTAHGADDHHYQKRDFARLTLDIPPELHLRLKIRAAQSHVSMRDVAEQLLEEGLPSLDQLHATARRLDVSQYPPISPASVERLRRVRSGIMGARTFNVASDELLHQVRNERDTGNEHEERERATTAKEGRTYGDSTTDTGTAW